MKSNLLPMGEGSGRCGGHTNERPGNLSLGKTAENGIDADHVEDRCGKHAEPGPEEIGPETPVRPKP